MGAEEEEEEDDDIDSWVSLMRRGRRGVAARRVGRRRDDGTTITLADSAAGTNASDGRERHRRAAAANRWSRGVMLFSESLRVMFYGVRGWAGVHVNPHTIIWSQTLFGNGESSPNGNFLVGLRVSIFHMGTPRMKTGTVVLAGH